MTDASMMSSDAMQTSDASDANQMMGMDAAKDASGCTSFDDDFAMNPLSPCWTVLNNSLIDIDINGGALHLRALNGQQGVWYQGSTKSLVYKALAGNRFVVTTIARPRKRTNTSVAPTQALHVGGIMARNPASNGGNTENYVFIMVGSNEQSQPGVEVKSTTNGASIFSEPVWSDALGAELRMCRIDAAFYLYKRVIGSQNWTLQDQNGQANPIMRSDLPGTLQVGLALNFSGPMNDLDVGFDSIALGATPNAPADCTK